MAEKLPKYTWSANTLTLKGTKKVVYSTVTGDIVGEIKNGKFVQTVDKIPQPTKRAPRTVTVPETARIGGVENTIASLERDANFYKSIAEDINKPASDRADARDEYNNLQKSIAQLKGEQEVFAEAEKGKTREKAKQESLKKFDSLKSEYQTIKKKFDALIDKTNDPKANQYRTRMNQIVNESLDVYEASYGRTGTVDEVTKLLSGMPVEPVAPRIEMPMGAGISPAASAATPAGTQTSVRDVVKDGTLRTPLPKTPSRKPAQAPSVEPVSAPITTPTPAGADVQSLLARTEFWYDLPDYIFETVPELGNLLVKAVNEDWDEAKFLAAARLTPWWQTKTGTFRTRAIDKAKYNELRAAGQDVSKTAFGQYLSKQMANIKAQAKQIAGVTLDDTQAQQIAEKIYDGNLDDDPLAINRLITPFITKVTDRYAGTDVTSYGGEALQNYQMLQAIAKANGLSLKDILPQISTTLTGGDLERAVLQGLATGDIDIQRVAQNARMFAAQGQPEYVRNLLNQGYDLEQVYAPYKRTMATILELEPDQIDLNDPTLRSAINNNGDMNIYDFKKALRKDSRWQYTENAREEVSNVALQVLRDFGFQG